MRLLASQTGKRAEDYGMAMFWRVQLTETVQITPDVQLYFDLIRNPFIDTIRPPSEPQILQVRSPRMRSVIALVIVSLFCLTITGCCCHRQSCPPPAYGPGPVGY